jgi:hypothetical protein
MRPLILASVAAAALLTAPAALAAPTCQNKFGDGMKCGTPGAMPVGWVLPREQMLAWEAARPADLSPHDLLALVCLLGGFFALIALMPDFDGWGAGERDEQAGDEERG